MKTTVIIIGLHLLFALNGGCAQVPQQGDTTSKAQAQPQQQVKPPEPTASPKEPSEDELRAHAEQLLGLMGSKNFREREEATCGIKKRIREMPDILPFLLDGLIQTEDPEVQERLKSVLAPYITWGITPAIARQLPDIGEMLKSNDKAIRKQAAIELGSKKPEGVINPLLRLLNDSEYCVQDAAVKALSSIGAPAVELLIEASKSDEILMRHAAIEALGLISDRRAVKPLIEALQSEEQSLRSCVAVALGRIGDKKAVQFLIEVLSDKEEDQYLRANAAEALGFIGDKSAIIQLTNALKLGEERVRADVATALGRIGERDAVPYLIETLRDKDVLVQGHSAWALGRIGDKRAVKALIELLGDENEYVRDDAARALGEINDKDAVPALLEVFQKDKSATARVGAAYALVKLTGDKQAFSFLLETVRNKEEGLGVRVRTAEALADIGDSRAVESLIQALNDEKNRMRGEAAWALVRFRDLRAVLPLINALRDESWDVRRVAAQALG